MTDVDSAYGVVDRWSQNHLQHWYDTLREQGRIYRHCHERGHLDRKRMTRGVMLQLMPEIIVADNGAHAPDDLRAAMRRIIENILT